MCNTCYFTVFSQFRHNVRLCVAPNLRGNDSCISRKERPPWRTTTRTRQVTPSAPRSCPSRRHRAQIRPKFCPLTCPRRKRHRCLPSPRRTPTMRLLARPWSPSRDLPPTTYRVTRPWQLAPRRSSLHRRKPRGASARPSPERQLPSSPSASARASLPMPP